MNFRSIRNIWHKSLHYLVILNTMLATLFAPLLLAENKELFAEHVDYDDDRLPAIPYCAEKPKNTITPRLIYVSTLDGSITALDIAHGGELYWSIRTEPGSLISSNIHNLELTNSGQFVRMVPSLNGGIYKFDGESIDPIPLAMDNLLSTSAKFSDDLVISGGKEMRTYGICVRTGKLLYECSMNGCSNETSQDFSLADREQVVVDDLNIHDPLADDVLVVRRQTQTVHAVDSRTGLQRWNFSVGQHQLDLSRSLQCNEQFASDERLKHFDVNIKVIVPEGIICAFSKSNPSLLLWKQKLDHPVVNIWKISANNNLVVIDPFSSATTFWNNDQSNNLPAPSLYLGMYDNQLYIQESMSLRKKIDDQIGLLSRKQIDNSKSYSPSKLPWHPFAANALPGYIENADNGVSISDDWEKLHNNKDVVLYDSNNDIDASAAQSILKVSENINGNGFYLFTNDNLQKIKNFDMCQSIKSSSLSNDNNFENLTPKISSRFVASDSYKNFGNLETAIKIVVLSLCFWWKEICVIVLTSVVLLYFLVTQRSREIREIVVIERHIPVPTAIEATESNVGTLGGNDLIAFNGCKESSSNKTRTLSQSSANANDSFCSRFQTEFDLTRCLGRGGFGVVFEAKNKLDDCKYAIKRITLPSREESRVRVMREVKTLANCEHQNIVRYFHSWVEKPPPGWQEEEDNKWLANEMSASMMPTDGQFTTSDTATDNANIHDQQHLKIWLESSSKSKTNSSTNGNGNARNIYFNERTKSDMVYKNVDKSRLQCSQTSSSIMKSVDEIEECISIDMNTSSSNDHINNSQLSSSFQIEFVGSADGKTHIRNNAIHIESDEESSLNSSTNNSCDSSINTGNNHSKSHDSHRDISNSITDTSKLTQNKVYLYIQMQLCRKESLREWLRDNNMMQRAEAISNIFHQIVDAVDYVHVKGLIHRDLKPSNIFFAQDGKIKIGDFGLVTDMPEIKNPTTTTNNENENKPGLPTCARRTQQVGTHLYMSPEQLRGLPYDHKVDIYSLGLIFFELLVYFSTEMERIVTLKSLRDGIYPQEFSSNHPKEYKLLQKMLSPVPEERPITYDLKLQLNDILQIPNTLHLVDSTTSANTMSSISSISTT